jgi:predicted cupin superfamily sugar epimerase
MAERPNADVIIDALQLESHPEGGYYRETYRADEEVQRGDGTTRNAGTGIYFLLTSGICTQWHRFGADELWHFYTGDTLVIETVDPEGNFNQLSLDDRFGGDGKFQQLVPNNCWQRAYSTGDYTLVGTTVFPGFEFGDFEKIDRQELAEQFPEIRSDIVRNPFG